MNVRTASDFSEQRRLAQLRALSILDTPPEQQFDDLVALASSICATPIALVSLVDSDRQWFKARHGLAATQTPRTVSFCAHAIRGTETFIVPDAQRDLRFADNPLVVGDPHIRFYAGVPLVIAGHALGTLCVIDREPRQLTRTQREGLEALARQTRAQLELHHYVQVLGAREASLAHQHEQLVIAEHRKAELTDLIVHDLKGPLTAILACGELVLEEPELAPQIREIATAIRDASEDMHRMVLDLLDVSASEDGQLVPVFDDIHLGHLMTQLERTFGHRAEAVGCPLRFVPMTRATTIRIDRDLIRRVLENLLDNALKYTRGRGSVVVSCQLGDGAATIRVADAGPGIPVDQRDAVFDKHVRLARDARHQVRISRGLGLAYCKLAVEAHGGRVWIEDNEPRGAVFCVRLPLAHAIERDRQATDEMVPLARAE